MVTKLIANGQFGRNDVPAYGYITKTFEGNLRVTPAAPGVPAQAYVRWQDGEETWERLSDINMNAVNIPRLPTQPNKNRRKQ